MTYQTAIIHWPEGNHWPSDAFHPVPPRWRESHPSAEVTVSFNSRGIPIDDVTTGPDAPALTNDQLDRSRSEQARRVSEIVAEPVRRARFEKALYAIETTVVRLMTDE